MSKQSYNFDDIILQILDNFENLFVGKYLNYYASKNDLSSTVNNYKIQLQNQTYIVPNDRLRNNLAKLSSGERSFGIFVSKNAFRAIFSGIYEGIKNKEFDKYLKSKLGTNYRGYIFIITLLRHFFSHNISKDYILASNTHELLNKQSKELKSKNIFFDLKYKEDLQEIYLKLKEGLPDLSENYGVYITIDLNKIDSNSKLLDIINEHNLYLLAELSQNLVYNFKEYTDKK